MDKKKGTPENAFEDLREMKDQMPLDDFLDLKTKKVGAAENKKSDIPRGYKRFTLVLKEENIEKFNRWRYMERLSMTEAGNKLFEEIPKIEED